MKRETEQKMLNGVAILAVIEAAAILYRGILCMETQHSVFDVESHVLIPLGIIAIILRLNEAINGVHCRKECLIVYCLLVIVAVIGFAASIINEQWEDVPYSFGAMVALIGLVCYDVSTSKTITRLEDL